MALAFTLPYKYWNLFQDLKNDNRKNELKTVPLRGQPILMTALLRWTLKFLITFYQLGISSWLPPRCRFLPTCSQYALDAIERYGPYKGSILAFKRLCRCHPWGGHGHDPVKEDEL